MVVDGAWPDDFPGGHEGKPTYEDLVLYCSTQGHSVSHSAMGRWAKGLLVFERMRTAAGIARDVMKDLASGNVGETQRAAAEIVTAQVIDLASREDLSAKQVKDVGGALAHCTSVLMKANDYVVEQIQKKAAAAARSTEKKLKKAGVDRKLIQEIIDEQLGVVK